MMKKWYLLLGVGALLMLSCQQPMGKENGAGTNTGISYNQTGVPVNIEAFARGGKDPVFKIDRTLYKSTLADEIINIPDPVFLRILVQGGVDLDGDGQISKAEALALTFFGIRNTEGLVSMEGLQEFKNVNQVIIENVIDLEVLPLELPQLMGFTLSLSRVRTLNFSQVPKLIHVGIIHNSLLNKIDLAPLQHTLESFTMYDVPGITHLDFRTFTHLNQFIVYDMENLLTFNLPDHHENDRANSNLYFATTRFVEALDMHNMPKSLHNVNIYGHYALKKVYINIDQYEQFMNNDQWQIDRPDILEVIF